MRVQGRKTALDAEAELLPKWVPSMLRYQKAGSHFRQAACKMPQTHRVWKAETGSEGPTPAGQTAEVRGGKPGGEARTDFRRVWREKPEGENWTGPRQVAGRKSGGESRTDSRHVAERKPEGDSQTDTRRVVEGEGF